MYVCIYIYIYIYKIVQKRISIAFAKRFIANV